MGQYPSSDPALTNPTKKTIVFHSANIPSDATFATTVLDATRPALLKENAGGGEVAHDAVFDREQMTGVEQFSA
jgi:hypothetical protein